MNFKQFALNSLKVSVATVGFLSIFYAMVELMYFLSDPRYIGIVSKSRDAWTSISWSLLIDMSLLSLFIIQHTFLASEGLKRTLNNYGLQPIYRSLYIISTAAVLHLLMNYWLSLPDVTLWKFNVNFSPIWWIYVTVHTFAWLVIYIGNICMDINELLGIKQVYYNIIKLPDPNSRKSRQLQRLNSHMRHPSFLAFLVIFWSLPVMSLDRFLLATILSLYMYLTWNTDEADYMYQKNMYIRKFHELERLKN